MSKMIILEGNSNDKDNVRAYMVKGEPGNDGVSPTLTVNRDNKIVTVTATDPNGTTTATVEDGVSPTVTTSKTSGVTTVTITDIDGNHTATINDGETYEVPTNSVIGWDSLNSIPGGYEEITGVVDIIYPVGSIYMSVNSTNPSNLFGGTWVAWGAGRVPVGVDTTQTEFDTVEETGGEKTHTLTTQEMPNHNHDVNVVYPFDFGGKVTAVANSNSDNTTGTASDVVTSTGGGQAHNNLQPYITCYMWKRTA